MKPKTEYIFERVRATTLISICISFFGAFILCMANVGLLIKGNTDDGIIFVVLVILSLITGWKISGKIIYEREQN